LAVTIVALAVAACTTAPPVATPTGVPTGVPTADPTVTADSRRVEISYANWFHGGSMEAVWNEYIASYLAAEPRVTGVRVETTPFTRYHDVLNVQLAAESPPDTAWINAAVGPQYVNSGKLVDLTPYIPADYDLADFGPALEPWSADGKLYGLPFTNASNLLYFNTDLFTDAGVKTPAELQAEGNWTWEALKSTAKQLVDAGVGAEYGFLFNNNIYTNGFRNLVDIWAPYGGGPWTNDGTTCTFNTAETKTATQLVWDMVYVDRSHPAPAVAADFAAGNIGMTLARQNFVPRLAEVPFGWDVTLPPSGPAGFVPSRAQNGVVAFVDSASPDLAAGFIIHAMNKDNAAKFGANTPAVRRSLQTLEILASFNPNFTSDQLERAVLPALSSDAFQMEYTHENYAVAEKAANLIFDAQIWNETADVSAALDSVCGAVDAFMSR
jgi:multiple sugar transport system substrate-binding protein